MHRGAMPACYRDRASLTPNGRWYEDFSQTTDDEVRELLERAVHEVGVGSSSRW